MHGYALASMAVPPEQGWCSLGVASSRVSMAEPFARENSRFSHRTHTHVMAAGLAVRAEWAKLSQGRRGLSLTAIIAIVSRRHAIFPPS